jgi:DNA-binding IscR family transcriptional regulator
MEGTDSNPSLSDNGLRKDEMPMTWSSLPKRAQSALRCLCCLAEVGTSLQSHQIAERIGTAKAETAKVLQLLSWGGFVLSKRGSNGGFWLSSPPDQIMAGQLISFFLAHHRTETDDDDPVSRAINKTSARCQAVLARLTLADIVAGRVPCDEGSGKEQESNAMDNESLDSRPGAVHGGLSMRSGS